MHEYSITQSIVDMAVSEAQNAGAKSIKEINLVIGELSSIIDESVQMYFDIISEDTIAKGAKLNFKWIKAELKCSQCEKTFLRKSGEFSCPYCGGNGRLTDVGKEFYIESIEVE